MNTHPTPLTGIHHVTAFAADPDRNRRFYTQTIGLTLVKHTVNFDDPTTLHLYYADPRGTPGTILTHFPSPRAIAGIHAPPEIQRITLAAPPDTFTTLRQRLAPNNDPTSTESFDFTDPDGMPYTLILRHPPAGQPPETDTPTVAGATIALPDIAPAADFLTDTLGFEHDPRTPERKDEQTLTLPAAPDRPALTLLQRPAAQRPNMGAGVIHHIAWRVPHDDAQRDIAERIARARVGVTPRIDRKYFRSIYFRVPGGVVFEIATDGPGFAVDEPADALGRSLRLPRELEHRRAELERVLPPLGGPDRAAPPRG